MRRQASYRLQVEAKYKTYKPITFDFLVRYLPNLDGKIRFVDLGTHVFYKGDQRPSTPYKFFLTNVMNDGVEDDNDNYDFELNDGTKTYYELTD